MITLYDSRTGSPLGTLTEDQLQELIDHLEEEWEDDQDYYINQPTVEVLEAAGVGEPVLNMLRSAIAQNGEVDIRWSRS